MSVKEIFSERILTVICKSTVRCVCKLLWSCFSPEFQIKDLRKKMGFKKKKNLNACSLETLLKQTDVFNPHCLSSALFLCCATGNVFRPTKSHAGWTTTQQESIDRSDQPNTNYLCLSAAVWKPLPAFREREDGNWSSFLLFFLRSISRFLPNNYACDPGRGGMAILEDNNCNDRRWW